MGIGGGDCSRDNRVNQCGGVKRGGHDTEHRRRRKYPCSCGFITSPEIALIGERSPEAIIPLDGSRRALELFKKTGEVLGVDSDGEGYSISSGGGVASVAPNVTVGNVNVSIEVSGVENATDFMQAVRENAHEISDVVAAKISEAVASVSRNQPLVA